jgi:hypothetical protein
MIGFPNSPRTVRGGIVLIDPATSAVLRVITLQYNPDSLTRTLQIKGAGQESGDHIEVMRLKGPPIETIKLDAEIDATDQLAAGDTQATTMGIHPQLAALETIVYPASQTLLANNSSASAGNIEIAPAEAPLTLFVWSKNRILPVRVTEIGITEEAFDAALNPIRAKVSLGMRVLTVDDLGFDNKGGNLFMSYLQQKEQLATMVTGSLDALGIRGNP